MGTRLIKCRGSIGFTFMRLINATTRVAKNANMYIYMCVRVLHVSVYRCIYYLGCSVENKTVP